MSKEDMEVLEARIAAAEKAERDRKRKEWKAQMKKERKGFFKEFKKFITRGNVLDMAVGVIIGGAFSAIVGALTNHILMPVINWFLLKITGGKGLDEIYTYLEKVEVESIDEVTGETVKTIDLAKSIYIDWGAFITAILNFILIALVLFLIIRTFNRIKENSQAVYCGYTKEEYLAFRKSGKTQEDIAAMAAARDEKAAADKKAAEEAAAAEEAKKAATLEQFYANIEKQTKLLEEIAKK